MDLTLLKKLVNGRIPCVVMDSAEIERVAQYRELGYLAAVWHPRPTPSGDNQAALLVVTVFPRAYEALGYLENADADLR